MEQDIMNQSEIPQDVKDAVEVALEILCRPISSNQKESLVGMLSGPLPGSPKEKPSSLE
jgi:hypothetical protein